MIIPWINNSTARGSGTNARQEMCVPGSSTTNWLSLHEMSKCRPRWSPQQVVWAYAACSAEDSPAFSFFGSLDLAVVTEGGRTAHENTIDDEQALPEVTWPQWERWACGERDEPAVTLLTFHREAKLEVMNWKCLLNMWVSPSRSRLL